MRELIEDFMASGSLYMAAVAVSYAEDLSLEEVNQYKKMISICQKVEELMEEKPLGAVVVLFNSSEILPAIVFNEYNKKINSLPGKGKKRFFPTYGRNSRPFKKGMLSS